MDFAETDKRKALKTQLLIIIPLSVIFLAAIVCILLISFFYKGPSYSNNDSTSVIPLDTEIIEDVDELPDIQPIDFQPIVDEWVQSVKGNRSVLIYDVELDELVASYNPTENYNTASLYKLFVVYDGYMKLMSQEWNPDDTVSWTGYSILDCLDLAIRESYSPCAESLWSMIGRDSLQETIVNDFDITDSNINSLISNPNDILKMMKIFYEHNEITDETLVERMKDSFLNQPITTYNWRQGLPSGFSRANVYNKVGWDYNPDGKYWNIYHDAAIVEFPEEDRHFIVVVMTNRVPYQSISSLGTMIEDAYYSN